jgi:hypothetical protein
MPEHEEMVLAVGPYLLGALDPETRKELRDHLDVCETCRRELVRLAAMPGFLSHAMPRYTEAELEPPAELRERLVARVLAERAASRRRVQVATAAALLLLFLPAGMFLGLRIGRSGAQTPAPVVVVSEPEPTYVEMMPVSDAVSLRGEVAWTQHEWGVQLDLQTWGGQPDQRLNLIAESRDGRREQAAAWEMTGERHPSTGTTSIHEQDMARVLVETADNQPLLVLDLTQLPSPT